MPERERLFVKVKHFGFSEQAYGFLAKLEHNQSNALLRLRLFWRASARVRQDRFQPL